MNIIDLTYTSDSMFTRFIPQTTAGENVWREMAEQNGGCVSVLNVHAKSVISQIRKAGYSVAKARPVKINMNEIDSLLAELTA